MTDTVTFTGKVVTLSYSTGKPKNFVGCEDCECHCHDGEPEPKGQYITIRLDDESTLVWLGEATVTGIAR